MYLKEFVSGTLATASLLWGSTEAYTYFRGDELKVMVGEYWVGLYLILPCIVGVFVSMRARRMNREFRENDELSEEELEWFRSHAIDRISKHPVNRPHHNRGLSDRELRRRIKERVREKKPVYLLLREYEIRLGHRSK